MWTVLRMLEWATDYFEQHGVDAPRLSIEWILADVLDSKRLDLYMQFDRPLSPSELDQIRPLVKRRAKHEPLQYITGYTDFHSVRIEVNPSVLIPRSETEQLVEIILDSENKDEDVSFLDIGTGSGCIPIALINAAPKWNAVAVDNSSDAIQQASHNAELNGTDITFHEVDLFDLDTEALPTPLNFIVSNPPYVLPEEREILDPQVREYEPAQALFTEDYLKLYRRIIEIAEKSLTPDGRLYLEIHHQKAADIITLFDVSSWKAEPRADYDGNHRFIVAKRVAERT